MKYITEASVFFQSAEKIGQLRHFYDPKRDLPVQLVLVSPPDE